jgi:hypothetical protein
VSQAVKYPGIKPQYHQKKKKRRRNKMLNIKKTGRI